MVRTNLVTAAIPIKPERQEQLEAFARKHGQNPADTLDEALALYLEQEHQYCDNALTSIERGYADVKTGRTRPAQDVLNELRQRHGFSR